VRPSVQVKLLAKDGETYVFAQSEDRIAKERSMRRRRLRKYLVALAALSVRKKPLGQDKGYTSKLPVELHLTRWVTGRLIDWPSNSRDKERPFFLNIGYFDQHHAFNPVESFAENFKDSEDIFFSQILSVSREDWPKATCCFRYCPSENARFLEMPDSGFGSNLNRDVTEGTCR